MRIFIRASKQAWPDRPLSGGLQSSELTDRAELSPSREQLKILLACSPALVFLSSSDPTQEAREREQTSQQSISGMPDRQTIQPRSICFCNGS